MTEELAFRLLALGIPFILGLFIPSKSKKQIDDSVESAIERKFRK